MDPEDTAPLSLADIQAGTAARLGAGADDAPAAPADGAPGDAPAPADSPPDPPEPPPAPAVAPEIAVLQAQVAAMQAAQTQLLEQLRLQQPATPAPAPATPAAPDTAGAVYARKQLGDNVSAEVLTEYAEAAAMLDKWQGYADHPEHGATAKAQITALRRQMGALQREAAREREIAALRAQQSAPTRERQYADRVSEFLGNTDGGGKFYPGLSTAFTAKTVDLKQLMAGLDVSKPEAEVVAQLDERMLWMERGLALAQSAAAPQATTAPAALPPTSPAAVGNPAALLPPPNPQGGAAAPPDFMSLDDIQADLQRSLAGGTQ